MKSAVAAALLILSLAAGCDTYHYYDVDVKFGTISEEQASKLQTCELVVTGADSHTATLPSNLNGNPPISACPPDHWPDMGTFEFASFATSGQLTFTVNGYGAFPLNSSTLCASGSTTMTADGTITQMGTITMGNFSDTNCPSSVTPGGSTTSQ